MDDIPPLLLRLCSILWKIEQTLEGYTHVNQVTTDMCVAGLRGDFAEARDLLQHVHADDPMRDRVVYTLEAAEREVDQL